MLSVKILAGFRVRLFFGAIAFSYFIDQMAFFMQNKCVMKNMKFAFFAVFFAFFVSGCLSKSGCGFRNSQDEKISGAETAKTDVGGQIGGDEIAVVDGISSLGSKKVEIKEGRINGSDLAMRELGIHSLGLMSEGSDFSNLAILRGFGDSKCVVLQIGDTLNCDELIVGEKGKETALTLVGDGININVDDVFSVRGEKTALEFVSDAVGISTIRAKSVGDFEGSIIIDISMHHSFKGFERKYILIAAKNDWIKQLGDLSDLDKNPKIKILKKHRDDDVKLYASSEGELILTFVMGGE